MVAGIFIVGIVVACVIVGISATWVISNEPIAVFEDSPNSSLTADEINKLEQSERIPSQFIKITSDNPEFFEKWCQDQNGNWDINQFQMGGVCFFESRTEKLKAELEWDKLQHPVVSGENAQKICHVLRLECNQDTEFEGWFDDETGYIKLDYSLHDKEYSFRIQGDSMEYARPDVSNFWYSYDETFGQRFYFEFSDEFYFAGDKIQVSGSIFDLPENDLEGVPVILQVFLGDNLIEVAQIPVSSDNHFFHQIKTEGPQWDQSGRYIAVASYDSGKIQKDFGFSTYYSDKPVKYFTDFDTEDHEELCGYPVTYDMHRDFIESWKGRPGDKDPFLTIKQGIFTHVERSNLLTDMPILHYWYELKNGQQVYFGMEACALDDLLFRAEPGPNYEKPQEFEIDGTTYVELSSVPGNPWGYKDTLLPVLDVDNCKRVADEYTEQERERLLTRHTVNFDPQWKNQAFPLMDYCTSIGDYELNTLDRKITWTFTEK